MRLLPLTILFLFSTVFCDTNGENKSADGNLVKNERNIISTKTKRGIHGYTSDLNYYSSVYGPRYFPYAKFPGHYRISPGNAIVQSYNVNYPKVILPKVIRPAIPQPILIHSKPVLPPLPAAPVYANRYPLFINKPVFQKPIVPIASAVPQFVAPIHFPSSSPHIHTVNPITVSNIAPQPSLEWRPIYSSVSNIPNSPPAITVLPPLNPSHLSSGQSLSQMSKNYYLPPDPTRNVLFGDIIKIQIFHNQFFFTEQYQQQKELHDLHHIQQLQAIQHNPHFFRSEQNEEHIIPLSEQGLYV